jgi:hypothetical protein
MVRNRLDLKVVNFVYNSKLTIFNDLKFKLRFKVKKDMAFFVRVGNLAFFASLVFILVIIGAS